MGKEKNMNHNYYMKIALEEAKKAYKEREVPIGCVLVIDNKIIAKVHNMKEVTGQAIYHAEVLAIKKACEKIGLWRLEGSYLYTTVEPCVMCSGAIIHSRVENVIYGTCDSKNGCHKSKIDLLTSNLFNHKVNVISGIMKEECEKILKDFFKEIREEKRKK